VTTQTAKTDGTRARPPSILRPPYRTATAAIVLVITLIAFEAMAVAAALPTAARALHGLSLYGWAFTGFLLADVVGMVASGQLCDARSPRLALTLGLIGFTGGLVLAGTATTMTQLIAGRGVQGLSSGLLITAVYVVIGETYPESLQPKVFAATASAWVLPALLGPLVSGGLAQHVSWRWVFLGLVPFVLVGAGMLSMAMRRLPQRAAAAKSGPFRADPRRIGRALSVAAGVGAMESAGQHRSWIGIVLVIVGVAVASWGLRGLLPAGTIRVRHGVAAPVALRGLLAGAFFGVEATIPLALTVQHGYGATVAGLPLACAGLSWATGSWWQGRIKDETDDHRRVNMMRTGFIQVAVAAAAVGYAEQSGAPGWLIYPAWALAGLGAGLTMSSTSVLLLRHTTDAERGADSASLQLADATSSAITTGGAGVLVAVAAAASISYNTAFGVVGAVLAGVALLGAVVTGRAAGPAAIRP
jgi:MFS family permease